jgi:hypothetical protein
MNHKGAARFAGWARFQKTSIAPAAFTQPRKNLQDAFVSPTFITPDGAGRNPIAINAPAGLVAEMSRSAVATYAARRHGAGALSLVHRGVDSEHGKGKRRE